MHSEKENRIHLQLFAEGGAVGGAEGGAPSAEARVEYGKAPADPPTEPKKEPEVSVTSDTKEDRKAAFETLIKGEYKDLFDERAQQIINARFKETKALEAQAEKLKALSPVMEILAGKYGVDSADAEAIAKAIQEDDSYFESEAADMGITVAQLKHMRKIERENAEFKRAMEEQQRKADADRIYGQWLQQADECKAVYSSFDLRAEINHADTGSRFFGLLKSGVDVRTAYEVVHKDDLIGGAMQYTAKTIQQKTVNDIRARGMRPEENGGSGGATAVTRKADPRTWTKKDRDEISRRVRRGERIEL